jgi:hypothetical protein
MIMAARKPRRKRGGKAVPAKASTHHLSNLKRHEAILHAIRCSNDLEWVDEVRRVAGERYNTVANNRTQKALDDKWSEVKNTWAVGSYVVRTTKRYEANSDRGGQLYRVQQVRKIKKAVVLCRAYSNAKYNVFEVEMEWLVNEVVFAVDQLQDTQLKAILENRIFELSMTEIGSAFE